MTAVNKRKHTEDQVGTVSDNERKRMERLHPLVETVFTWSEEMIDRKWTLHNDAYLF